MNRFWIGVLPLLASGCTPYAAGYLATGSYVAASRYQAQPQPPPVAPQPMARPTPRSMPVRDVPPAPDEVDPWATCPCDVDGITLTDDDMKSCRTEVQTLRSVHRLYRRVGAAEPPQSTAIYVRELGACVSRVHHAQEQREQVKFADHRTVDPAPAPEPTEAPEPQADTAAPADPDVPEPEPEPTPAPPPRKLTAAERHQLEERRKAAAEERARKKAEKAEQKRLLAEGVEKIKEEWCGPAPERSAWDGIYDGLKRAFESIANDPDSIEFQGCTNLERRDPPACWVTTCAVRGKNAFGAKILNTYTFGKSTHGWRTLKR